MLNMLKKVKITERLETLGAVHKRRPHKIDPYPLVRADTPNISKIFLLQKVRTSAFEEIPSPSPLSEKCPHWTNSPPTADVFYGRPLTPLHPLMCSSLRKIFSHSPPPTSPNLFGYFLHQLAFTSIKEKMKPPPPLALKSARSLGALLSIQGNPDVTGLPWDLTRILLRPP